MAQNTSSAVMQQRSEPHDSLDFFPTQPWATRALCHWLQTFDSALMDRVAWEPACGAGDMAKPLAEYFKLVHASDVHDYGFGAQSDFLFPHSTRHLADWIIASAVKPRPSGRRYKAASCYLDKDSLYIRYVDRNPHTPLPNRPASSGFGCSVRLCALGVE